MTNLLWLGVFTLSLGALVWASSILIDAAERIGLRLGMAPFVVGILIVGVGTSVPELVSSVYAVFAGATEFVVGNVLGSNITNILLVLGIAGLVGREVRLDRDLLHIDLSMLLGSTLLLGFLIMDANFSRLDAALCLLGTVIYIYSTVATNTHSEKTKEPQVQLGPWTWLRLVGSLLLIVVSAKYTVDAAVILAGALGVGTEVIALSAVALGTSLPEIAVAITAARRGKIALAVGNVMGSNIFNAFAVMGVPGLITPLTVPDQVIVFSLPFLIAVTLLYIIIMLDAKINRFEAALLLLFYAYFIGHLYQLA
ncbi:MAG: calcium/sodium antiporter [Gammaproteobacteria bacterium]|nr:calcium/sodium antiporter [Gammaproteobacteria bacterium]